MNNSILKLLSSVFIALLIGFSLLITNLSKAESERLIKESDKVEEMTDKLVKKLLLTNEQSESVISILTEYFLGVADAAGNDSEKESLRNIANTKILDLLNKKQKMKFEIIESDWWSIADK